MKLLFDEPLAYSLHQALPRGWDILTVQRMNWRGMENGDLLLAASMEQFDAMITVDKNMRHQQNEATPIPVIILDVNRLDVHTMRRMAPAIIDILEGGPQNTFHVLR